MAVSIPLCVSLEFAGVSSSSSAATAAEMRHGC